MNQSKAITLDAVLREAIFRDSNNTNINENRSNVELTLDTVLQEAFKRDTVLTEQLLSAREVDSMENLIKQSNVYDPLKPNPNLRVFPTQMGPSNYLTKTEKEMDKIVADKLLKPWPENLAAAENLFKTQVFRTDQLSTNNAGRLTNAPLKSYNWQVPVYATDLKSGTLFHFQPNGLVYMRPDNNTSTKFEWKLSGNKITISNPKGQVFGNIFKKGRYLVFDLTDDVKSGEFDIYKDANLIKKFFLIAGHGVKDTNLYKRQATGFENFEDKTFEQLVDAFQTILDWAGLIPGYGDIIDLLNALIYFNRGRKLEGALSLIGVIPIAGSITSLAMKRLIARVRFGTKSGADAIQAALDSEKEFIKLWQQNARQRKNVKEFIKNLAKKAKQIGAIKQALVAYMRSFRRTNKQLSEIGEQLVTRYGDKFQDYVTKNAAEAQRLLAIAEEGADELFLATAVKTYEKGTKQEILKATSKFFTKSAPSMLRQVSRKMLAFLPKKVWDSVATSMVKSFTDLCRKRPDVFLASILNTPGGKQIFFNIMLNNKKSLIDWVKNSTFRTPGGGNIAIARSLGLPANLLTNTNARNVDNEIWNAFAKIINTGSGQDIYKKIIMPIFVATKQQGSRIVGELATSRWLSEFIQQTINSGNIIFVEYTKTFWARFCALAPNAIYNSYDVGKTLGIKYDWKTGGVFDPVFSTIQDYLSKYSGFWVKYILKPINTFLYTIQKLFANPKSVDVIYNEFQDLLEKTGAYSKDRDQRQGVIVSFISWLFGTGNMIRYIYQNYVEPTIKTTKEVLRKTPFVAAYEDDPTKYSFVVPGKDGKKPKVQFQTPSEKGLNK